MNPQIPHRRGGQGITGRALIHGTLEGVLLSAEDAKQLRCHLPNRMDFRCPPGGLYIGGPFLKVVVTFQWWIVLGGGFVSPYVWGQGKCVYIYKL